jgi:hypothetical protein
MSRIRMESVPRRGEGVRSKQFGEAGVLLNVVSGEYFQVDDVGLAVWEQVDGRKTAGEIVEALSARYAADEGVLAGEAVEILEDLMTRGLISVGA